MIAEQLDAMAYIMQDCAREEKILDVGERHVLSEIPVSYTHLDVYKRQGQEWRQFQQQFRQ